MREPQTLATEQAQLLPSADSLMEAVLRPAGGRPRYLHDGDVITATIASPDGRLDLGTQHNTIIGKTP